MANYTLTKEQAKRKAQLITLARETLSACEEGIYPLHTGIVDISAQIQNAISGTNLYFHPTEISLPVGRYQTTLEVTQEASVQAAMRLQDNRPGCLNFASARRPGGGFQNGAMAQEETLAYASALYPCLLKFYKEYYEEHRNNEDAMYTDRIIWSPKVPFFRDHKYQFCRPYAVNILTCAAPNAGAMENKNENRLREVLTKRASDILTVLYQKNCTTLILGAWGCGVFANDPQMVATVFSDLLNGPFQGVFKHVCFAVYGNQEDPIFKTFSSTLMPLSK